MVSRFRITRLGPTATLSRGGRITGSLRSIQTDTPRPFERQGSLGRGRHPISRFKACGSGLHGKWLLDSRYQNGIVGSVDTGRLVWHGESDQIVNARIYYSQVLALMKSPSRYQWVTWQISDGKQMDSKTVPLPGEHPRIHWAERGAVIITETGAVGLVQNTKSSPIGQEK